MQGTLLGNYQTRRWNITCQPGKWYMKYFQPQNQALSNGGSRNQGGESDLVKRISVGAILQCSDLMSLRVMLKLT